MAGVAYDVVLLMYDLYELLFDVTMRHQGAKRRQNGISA